MDEADRIERSQPLGFAAATGASARLGTARVFPPFARAGEMGTVRVQLEVGAEGIAAGGGIRVQLPDSWHMGERNISKPVHAVDPVAANFVAGACSPAGARIRIEVEGGATEGSKINRTGLDGRRGRYVYVVRAVVEGAGLEPGETLEVIYGERSAGGPGFDAARWTDGPEEVLVRVDPTGSGEHLPLAGEAPCITVRSAEVAEVVLTAPSTVAVGQDAELHIAVLDRYGNRCADFVGEVALRAAAGVRVRERVVFAPEDAGVKRVAFRVEEPGVVRVRATDPVGREIASNPIASSAAAPGLRLYWGDVHAHACHSFDAIGRSPFDYAREVSAIDVLALTDHCENWPTDTWGWLCGEVRDRCEPGSFVTLLGYEAAFGPPWGHHNVYFPGVEGVVSGSDRGTLLDLFTALEGTEALVVPHHTGVRWGGTEGNVSSGATPNPDWRYHDPRLRRLIEIYSGHGQSERYDPEHPLSYENAAYDLASSNPGPHYAWDAWGRGYELGVIAGSDNHHGQPGRGELGLTGFWAPELTREAIYGALTGRRTYATTGARILLDFTLNGAPMGATAESDGSIAVNIRAHGTGTIESVELMAGDPANGRFGVAKRWTPDAADFVIEWEGAT
ncbi:MAG: DUF3604 domain-containing protein, partial [Acidimicrobiales bacterium]